MYGVWVCDTGLLHTLNLLFHESDDLAQSPFSQNHIVHFILHFCWTLLIRSSNAWKFSQSHTWNIKRVSNRSELLIWVERFQKEKNQIFHALVSGKSVTPVWLGTWATLMTWSPRWCRRWNRPWLESSCQENSRNCSTIVRPFTWPVRRRHTKHDKLSRR